MSKEYLDTTFPDGTPVKIYPVKDQTNSPSLKGEKFTVAFDSSWFQEPNLLKDFIYIDKKILESLCKQVLEAKCPEGAEYAIGTFHSCPFCENTSTNAYNTDIDLIEHDEDCAYNIAKDLLDDKGLQQSVSSTSNQVDQA